jgi:hypothetical protein
MNTFTKRLLWLTVLGAALIVAAWLLGMTYVLTD